MLLWRGTRDAIGGTNTTTVASQGAQIPLSNCYEGTFCVYVGLFLFMATFVFMVKFLGHKPCINTGDQWVTSVYVGFKASVTWPVGLGGGRCRPIHLPVFHTRSCLNQDKCFALSSYCIVLSLIFLWFKNKHIWFAIRVGP